MPDEGGWGGTFAPLISADQLTLFQAGGQIMPTKLLPPPPDIWTVRRLWSSIIQVTWQSCVVCWLRSWKSWMNLELSMTYLKLQLCNWTVFFQGKPPPAFL